MHLGEFHGSSGRVLQRTETTPAQLETLRAPQIAEPPRFLAIEPAYAAWSDPQLVEVALSARSQRPALHAPCTDE